MLYAMSARRLGLYLALACAATWGVKALAIWNAGGLNKSSFEAPLFGLGFLLSLAALAVVGVAITGGKHIAVRVLGAVAGLVAALLVVLASDGVAGMVVPDSAGWVQEEAGLWFAALVIVVAAFLVNRRRTSRG